MEHYSFFECLPVFLCRCLVVLCVLSKPAKVAKQRAERAKPQGPRVEARCEEIVQKEGEEDQVTTTTTTTPSHQTTDSRLYIQLLNCVSTPSGN